MQTLAAPTRRRVPHLRRPLPLAALVSAFMLMAGTFVQPAPLGRATPEMAVARVDVDPELQGLTTGTVSVIVQSVEGAQPVDAGTIRRLGGSVTHELPLINGLAATIPAAEVAELTRVPGVRAISLDRKVEVQGGGTSSSPDSVYPQVVEADKVWNQGGTGAGVTVALLDTGIADVADVAHRVLSVKDDLRGTWSRCVNLSGEAGCQDSYGHGTFIAGLIAGNGASSGGEHKGVAPGANLVSIKVAGRSGASDVSTVIAGIQWAVSFRDRYGIRVLNLSLGTDGTQTYRTDPLNFAVEKAWSSGVTVVVAASNRGPAAGTISKPGDDPWVITVGAIDDMGTPGLGDDRLPDFTSRGPTAADGLPKPDVVAPGAHMVSLRSPGSAIDTQFPNYVDGAYRKGSGTSMAAGVVSGGVALVLEANQGMTPDRVKHALMATARNSASNDPMAVGRGLVDLAAAALDPPPGVANQGLARSNGLGSLDASRGSARVLADAPTQTVVGGLLTAQLALWNPLLYPVIPWTSSSWYGSSWYGSSWYGSSWYGSSWYGSSWYGSSWYGSSWYGSSWYGSSWYGSSWYGAWE